MTTRTAPRGFTATTRRKPAETRRGRSPEIVSLAFVLTALFIAPLVLPPADTKAYYLALVLTVLTALPLLVRIASDTVDPGRPVLVAANPASQAAQLLQDADGGMLVAPDDPEALAAAARWFATAEPDVLAAFGKRGRAYADRHFDQRKIFAAQEQLIFDTLRTPLGTTPGSTPVRR